MKAEIHPEYKEATVHCVCGNTWTTRSTIGNISVDICSACHPFYTGKQKLIDSAGRVERFRKRTQKTEEAQAKAAERAAKKQGGKPAKAEAKPRAKGD